MGYIYIIKNDINSKVYIGQTTLTPETRFKRHCAEARWKKRKNMPIINAIHLYGSDHFWVETVAEVKTGQDDLNKAEIFYARRYNSFSPNGYNLRAGSGLGTTSLEVRRKISESNKGKKASSLTIERLRNSHLGYKPTMETREKLRRANVGKILTIEHRRAIATSNKGKTKSKKSREIMRQKKLKYEYEVTSPDGQVYHTKNLKQFAHEKQLNQGHMGSVASGKKSHHMGWKINRKPITLAC